MFALKNTCFAFNKVSVPDWVYDVQISRPAILATVYPETIMNNTGNECPTWFFAGYRGDFTGARGLCLQTPFNCASRQRFEIFELFTPDNHGGMLFYFR